MKCIESGLLELTEKLANFSDTAVRLISKAIIGHLSVECPNKEDHTISLTDEEITTLLTLLKSGSDVPLCISDCTIASMLKSFMSNKANVERFEQHKLTQLLEQKWNSSNVDIITMQLNSSSLDNANIVENSYNDKGNAAILYYIEFVDLTSFYRKWSSIGEWTS